MLLIFSMHIWVFNESVQSEWRHCGVLLLRVTDPTPTALLVNYDLNYFKDAVYLTGNQDGHFSQCNTISNGANWKKRKKYIISAHFWLPAQTLLLRNRLNQRFNMQTNIRSEVMWECCEYLNMHYRLSNLYKWLSPLLVWLKRCSWSFFHYLNRFSLVASWGPPCWDHMTSQLTT